MRLVFLAALCLLLLAGANPAAAQKRVYRRAALWPELQLDYVLPSGSMWYFRNHYRHVVDQDFNYLRQTGPLQYLERVQFRLGYEHAFNAHWRAGLSESYALERNRNILFNEIFARYTEEIGFLQLAQRISLEHLVRWPKNNNGRLRLRTELDRTFALGRYQLRPRVSYELFYVLAYHPRTGGDTPRRWVDRSRLRLEGQLMLSKHLAFTPYFMCQTDYFFVEPAFDGNNQVLRAGGKQNHLTPVWGLDLRYALFKKAADKP
ncbi:MAG: hypothetical protein ACO1O1_09555 [Adhaeribacter sp.]